MGISRRVASTRRRALRVRARAHAHDRFFRTDGAAARRTNAPIAVGRRFESRRAPFLSHPHACDARRTMVSLNARRNERSSSNKASEIINGFLSSPVRVFYSILFICALEVLLWSVVLVPGRTSGAWNDAASSLQRYQLRHLLLLLRSSPLRFGQGRNRTRTTASAGDQRVECGDEEFPPRLQRRFC